MYRLVNENRNIHTKAILHNDFFSVNFSKQYFRYKSVTVSKKFFYYLSFCNIKNKIKSTCICIISVCKATLSNPLLVLV